MERYLKDLKIKWQTSLDLLTEEVGAPYGAFLRFLPEAWEVFATNTVDGVPLLSDFHFLGSLSERDLNLLLEEEPYCRRIDLSRVNRQILPLLEQRGITDYCGFSVKFEKELFGLLFLAGNRPFEWNSKRETFLRRFKTLLEEDLQALADKARYCDELTQARLKDRSAGFEADLLHGSSLVVPAESPSDYCPVIHREEIPILPLMDDIHRSHESYMPQGVKLVTRIRCPSDYALFTDGYYLKQILSSLLTQAENHTWQGEVKIECRLDREERHFLFTVSDKGKGITWENWSHGLAGSRLLSEKLGGRLTVNTCEKRGNHYVLSLPVDHLARAMA
ncbi:MAG: ATP-binding protein [Spirochaetales bacterium]|nr:ATP-binding protein [Spirochaetales bacterium]